MAWNQQCGITIEWTFHSHSPVKVTIKRTHVQLFLSMSCQTIINISLCPTYNTQSHLLPSQMFMTHAPRSPSPSPSPKTLSLHLSHTLQNYINSLVGGLTFHVAGVGDVVSVDEVPDHDQSDPATAHAQVSDPRCLAGQVRILALEDGILRLLHLLDSTLYTHTHTIHAQNMHTPTYTTMHTHVLKGTHIHT